jgi:signal recognition particle receptor subunit alpha
MLSQFVISQWCLRGQVGAALSMVYSSGAPIMFVGCGQTYVDLTKLNVKSIVRSLLK